MYRSVRDLKGQEVKTSKGKDKLEARSLSRNGCVARDEWYDDDGDPRVVLVPRVKGHSSQGGRQIRQNSQDKRKPTSRERAYPVYDTGETEGQEARPHHNNALLIIGAGMAGTLLLLWLLVMVVIPWWNGLQTQWHYGDSHVSHYDLGEHHFLGEVYRGFVTVYDIPQGHPEKSRVFMLQSATDNAVVQFEIRDANSDGIPDITVGTEGSSIGVTLYSYKDGSFSQQPPQEGK
ncbi:hypothetical protein KSC_064740 [Ktedonobacter sp. SOSP1-52]|uniref:hypothetical protein n=1 Tax=Ktedonobacter sp. SOSP1-52 TaxID=2778366 RepID=UPI001915A1E3|nr:hypothetical protein [Ktedonobacter sp. SOSP1-52]GHO67582.1 hypothetical protein KSC_064740 [Ktedonobacter sp. SOSP1-52]